MAIAPCNLHISAHVVSLEFDVYFSDDIWDAADIEDFDRLTAVVSDIKLDHHNATASGTFTADRIQIFECLRGECTFIFCRFFNVGSEGEEQVEQRDVRVEYGNILGISVGPMQLRVSSDIIRKVSPFYDAISTFNAFSSCKMKRHSACEGRPKAPGVKVSFPVVRFVLSNPVDDSCLALTLRNAQIASRCLSPSQTELSASFERATLNKGVFAPISFKCKEKRVACVSLGSFRDSCELACATSGAGEDRDSRIVAVFKAEHEILIAPFEKDSSTNALPYRVYEKGEEKEYGTPVEDEADDRNISTLLFELRSTGAKRATACIRLAFPKLDVVLQKATINFVVEFLAAYKDQAFSNAAKSQTQSRVEQRSGPSGLFMELQSSGGTIQLLDESKYRLDYSELQAVMTGHDAIIAAGDLSLLECHENLCTPILHSIKWGKSPMQPNFPLFMFHMHSPPPSEDHIYERSIQINTRGLTLRYDPESSWLFNIIDFFLSGGDARVAERPHSENDALPSYTSLIVHFQDSLVDYCPLDVPTESAAQISVPSSRLLLQLDSFRISSNIATPSSIKSFRIALRNASLFLSADPPCREDFEHICGFVPRSSLASDFDAAPAWFPKSVLDYVEVMGFARIASLQAADVFIRTSSAGSPSSEIEISIPSAQVFACHDSLACAVETLDHLWLEAAWGRHSDTEKCPEKSPSGSVDDLAQVMHDIEVSASEPLQVQGLRINVTEEETALPQSTCLLPQRVPQSSTSAPDLRYTTR